MEKLCRLMLPAAVAALGHNRRHQGRYYFPFFAGASTATSEVGISARTNAGSK